MNQQNILPKVTIGMPVYNGEKYIREALDSLLTQTFTDFELIISDNCSTDATKNICCDYATKDKRIRYIRQQENRGALANFQFVLNKAQGEFFMWAAYDDKWDKDWIECLKNALENSGGGAAFGTLVHIDENSMPLKHLANGRTFEFSGSPLMRRVHYFIEFEPYGKANPIYSLFRRSILTGLDMASYSVDFHIVFNLLLKTEIIAVSNVILHKRVHTTSEGSESENGSATIFRRLSYLLMPIDIGFVQGYFQWGSIVEKFLFAIYLPIKIIFAYVFYFKRLILKIR